MLKVNSAPILFLVFNRPDTTARVFEVIKQIKPSVLFIAADGPRMEKEGEFEKCEQVKKIVSNIDWDCQLKTLYRSQNMGCKEAVSTAITWFFEHVNEGIILEDDCLPDPSFFSFCSELLEYYREDEKVMHICGTSVYPFKNAHESYYFSKVQLPWGWASWRRAWKYFDVDMTEFNEELNQEVVSRISDKKDIQEYWKEIFRKPYRDLNTIWDYQWMFAILKKDGLTIKPTVNLISNIGFGENSTNTVYSTSGMDKLKTGSLTKIVHPTGYIQYPQADNYEFKTYHNSISYMNKVRNIFYRILPSSVLVSYRNLKKILFS